MRRLRAAQRGNNTQLRAQLWPGVKWPSGAEDAEARKLEVIGWIELALHWARARDAALAQVNHAANHGIVVQPFLRVTQHVVGAIDAFHLHGSLLSCQVGMVTPRQLAISALESIAVCV